jgi:putative spermidine/putrescine transport system substrate-binding protein
VSRHPLSSTASPPLMIVIGLALFASFLAGCGGGGDGDGPAKIGEGEGQLDLIAWAGYVEDGTTDPAVDWVTDFENETGCQVNVKVGNSSDEMVELMRTGQYDGVSASGDATLRLIEGGNVAPINTDLVPNYENVFAALKDQPHNTVDGVHYGIPHGRGANLLMWNPSDVRPDPSSWDVVFDPAKAYQYKGHVTAYDTPIYIADAALYLRAHQPELGIKNIYELDQKQFSAAIELLNEQKQHVGRYWSVYTDEVEAFTKGDSTVGTTWQVIANLIGDEKVKVKTVLPSEGATGWSDTWMLSSEAEHLNCMYLWMDHIIDPRVNAQVAEWFGEAPANARSCEVTEDPSHCDVYHADDEVFFDQVEYWTTPSKNCGDERGPVCMGYDAWVAAWNKLRS